MYSTKKIYLKTFFLTLLCLSLIHAITYSREKELVDTTGINTSTTTATNTATTNKTTDAQANQPNNPTSSANSSKSTNTTDSNAEVLSVRNHNNDSADRSEGIGNIIFITVSHFNDLLQQSKDQPQNISLYINGRKIDDIQPVSAAPNKDSENTGTFQYRLDRNAKNDKTWADILGAPSLSNEFFKKPVKISVGLENGYAIKIHPYDPQNPLDTRLDGNNFTLIRIHEQWFWPCCIIVIACVVILIYMARNRGMLRDRSIDLSAIGISNNSLTNPYSLGRFQMAFWFTLTIISFFFIWLITDAYNILSTTVLALIGISAGTSLSAAVIDNSKSTDLLNQTLALQNELAQLNTDIPALQSSITTPPPGADIIDLQNKLNIKKARALVIPPLIANNTAILTPQASNGFLNDILTDVNGISFHRLQMFVWTFILGLIFLYSVWKSLSMPEFDAALLALQGLAAGTYLGFKFPEKQS